MYKMNYKDFLVNKDIALHEAMKKINLSEIKILFVVDENKILGSLTDGDIRRYLISNGKVDDVVEKACNKSPRIALSFEEAKKMVNKTYFAIPIVDNEGNVINIFLFNDNNEVEYKSISIPVVINAGGKGTRLEPFTKVLPKPLIPVGEYPIMEHIMKRFELFGCNKFYSVVNYKKQLIKAYFKENDTKYDLECIDEEEPLGTAGGLCLLKNKINEAFFFVNCDTLLMSDYYDIYKNHCESRSDITLVCAKKNIKIPFGIIDIKDNNELKEIKEKPEYNFLTNIGFYIINKNILDDMKDNTKVDMPDLIKQEQIKDRKINVYIVDEEDWLDMGQFPELERMRKRITGEKDRI